MVDPPVGSARAAGGVAPICGERSRPRCAAARDRRADGNGSYARGDEDEESGRSLDVWKFDAVCEAPIARAALQEAADHRGGEGAD